MEAATENLVIHAGAVQRCTAPMRFDEAADRVVVDSRLACDTFNFILRARNLTHARAAAAIASFEGRPFSWWLAPGDDDCDAMLGDCGLAPAESEVAMRMELASLREEPPALQIERVRTPEQLRDFARVNAANWTPPDSNVIAFYERAAEVAFREDFPLWFYAGYADGEAVACSELTVGGGVVGLYNIATLASHRRRGYGSAMTLRPLLDARAAGHRTAILQASADGVGVYRRLGFEAFGEVTEYK